MSENMKDLRNRSLKDTQVKHKHGTVYGNLNGVNANHDFNKYPINEKYNLEQYISYLEKIIEEDKKTKKVMKKAIIQNEKRISTLERKLSKYGLE